ncbi:hypothetical protein [Alkalicoccus luteus]|nr:hypothetical protein [Alkalicoccus luteus]
MKSRQKKRYVMLGAVVVLLGFNVWFMPQFLERVYGDPEEALANDELDAEVEIDIEEPLSSFETDIDDEVPAEEPESQIAAEREPDQLLAESDEWDAEVLVREADERFEVEVNGAVLYAGMPEALLIDALGVAESQTLHHDFQPPGQELIVSAVHHAYEDVDVYVRSHTGDVYTIVVQLPVEELAESDWEELDGSADRRLENDGGLLLLDTRRADKGWVTLLLTSSVR